MHHRLMALAFIDKPERHRGKSFDELQVNHIDGNKANNRLDNLEWVTRVENMEHAIRHGLIVMQAVMSRNIQTNEIRVFQSAEDCAHAFGVSTIRMRKHVASPRAGMVTKKWCVFKTADGKSWPELYDEHYEENSWEMVFGAWFATDVATGKVVIAQTLPKLAEAIGVSVSGLQGYFKRSLTPYLGKWMIRYDDLALPDALKKISHYKERVMFAPKLVIATNTRTGEVQRFASRNIAGSTLVIHPDRIRYAMKARGGIVGDWQFIEEDPDVDQSILHNRITFKEYLKAA
ncbi:HNH endonuclease signature motif containing protein [Paraburkholderia sp. GAS448]|uniref:HNH endonuclease signature motif containing protein n=1 Tax=Paraburkholderia sp. GAS448 TaxID=3035136 RepID=UPI003D19E0F4